MNNTEENKALMESFGPLAQFIGIWEGNKGEDISPGMPDRMKVDTERNYFERWVFEAVDPATENHDQKLKQLVADTFAWRGTPSTAGHVSGEAFHHQRGFWVWDPATNMLLNSFAVPRGIVVNAGGIIDPNAKAFELVAEAGSEIYGVCQNPYLIENFKVVKYILRIKLNEDGSIDSFQDTQLKMKGKDEIFHHTDINHMVKVS